MKPSSQVGIPSELPRPQGPDVLPALGGARELKCQTEPPSLPERQRQGLRELPDARAFCFHFPSPSSGAFTGRASLGEITGPPAAFVRPSAKWNRGPWFQKYEEFQGGDSSVNPGAGPF